jgi:hypothetical protein
VACAQVHSEKGIMNRKLGYWFNAVQFGLLALACGGCVYAQSPASPAETSHHAGADAPASVTLRHTVEDWSVISLDKSELKMSPPTPGEIDKERTYTRERWQVQWRDMDPIDLYIVKPVGVEKPPVIFYLYSSEVASKRPYINDGWCQRATAGGFAAIGFVPALAEDRFQMRPMKQWYLSELQEALGETTHDVQMILKFLEQRQDFDLTRVGIFGTGSGATVGILAAAADARIQSLDLLNPWGDWPNWIRTTQLLAPVERKDYATPEFLGKVAPLDPVKWLPTLSDRQIRIQIIDEQVKQERPAEDNVVAAAANGVRVIHYATVADHKAASEKSPAFQWVKDQLRPPGPLAIQNTTSAGNAAAPGVARTSQPQSRPQ